MLRALPTWQISGGLHVSGAHGARVALLPRHMPIASLVVTLDDRTALRQCALARLVEDRRVEIGEPRGPHLPIVLDTLSAEEGVHAIEDLLSTPGVLGVDVVRIDFAVDEDPQ